MSSDSFKESTLILKQAVPLMIKHKVPTTPTSYALWYTYASQQAPELNEIIDKAILEAGHCTPSLSESLYQQHLATQTDTNISQLKHSLEAVVQEITHTMDNTLSNTESFQKTLDTTFEKLARVEKDGLSLGETIKIVKELLSESGNIQASTHSFQDQLCDAQNEITELRQALSASQKAAHEDALTGLFNRRAFDADLESYISSRCQFGLVMLDIDRFKLFNDEFGHLLGDQVLKSVGRRLKESCREGIQAYRFGGEEFALIIPHKNLVAFRQHAENLRRSFEKISVLDKKSGKRINSITASFGIASFSAKDTAPSLIERADGYLKQAKELGRNRVMPAS